MHKNYQAQAIEKKWQKIWETQRANRVVTPDQTKERKFYALVEFPYPSGEGLHVGHVRGYTAMDIIARKRRFEGYNVLYPIGWDAFGLPTENYAIKTGIHPEKVTKKNTDVFRRQLKSLGFSFDWSREINTTDPAYYRWTQWIFLQLHKKGLAYKAKIEINWCLSCKIGLANEEVVDGRCERCGGPIERREKEQWMLAITKYADRLHADLDTVDYWDKIKIQQRNWIGRSEGAEIIFPVFGTETEIRVFTTRVDTVFGCSYIVIAPEHPLLTIAREQIANLPAVEHYIRDARAKSDLERAELAQEKTGIQLEGIEAIHPFNSARVPVYVADYVLGSYGTGAVMGVPAHDERDAVFAKKYDLPVHHVVAPYIPLTGICAPLEGKETTRKDCVTAFIKHPTERKYLALQWPDGHSVGFVGGGLEAGETTEEAILREVKEETGFQNFSLVETLLPHLYGHGYKPRKDVNCFDHDTVFVVQLDDLERQGSEEETGNHVIVWLDETELEERITLDHHRFMWRHFLAQQRIFCDEGILVESGEFTGLTSALARERMTDWLVKEGFGHKKVNYKLRDWVFSRQRYWGEPIPMVYCEHCATQNDGQGWVPLPESELPLRLPKVESYVPTDTGESPLAAMEKWVQTKCPSCRGKARRETDTMPNWAGSSWYFLRYTDPENATALADPRALKYFLPVDWYNGGMEHTTLHLLYSRFWHKFLFDIHVVPTAEPYQKRTSHGLILAEGGVKMSKSKGNVVNPDAVVGDFGADTLRVYEMFMGPFDQPVAWNTSSIAGSRRFLEKVWKLQYRVTDPKESNGVPDSTWHRTVKKVSEDIENMHFNTAVSTLMMLVNEMEKAPSLSAKMYGECLILLAPFAPHITEELWSRLGNTTSIFVETWPKWDEAKLVLATVSIAVQVNGKVRTLLEVAPEASETSVFELAQADPKVSVHLAGRAPRKIVFVPGKILSIVV